MDGPNTRPCAVIGPDRIVPPPAVSDTYLKKSPVEPWPCTDSTYRRPPDYPQNKLANFQSPSRNISPRQTFQENMQRIMVPPTYSSVKVNDDATYTQITERSSTHSKNIKLNVPPDAKFCEVPYVINPTSNEPKNFRNSDMCLPSVNPVARTPTNGWPMGSANLRSSRAYGAPEMYQYPDYPSCAGPRPTLTRPHRAVPEEPSYMYAEPYYPEGNIRFKPYPSVKERYPQQRYDFVSNYPNSFHPPPNFPNHKYELPKSVTPSQYPPPYPPIKYVDNRVPDSIIEGFQRNPQGNYPLPYRNQIVHHNYGPVIGNCPQNKMQPYPQDPHLKNVTPNKVTYENNAKTYLEYENSRPKLYPPSDGYFINEMSRMHPIKNQVLLPNYPSLNMHNVPPQYFKKDSQQMKNYEYMAHYRAMDPNLNIHNAMPRHPVFSPNTLAISPTESNASNDIAHTLVATQEDFGYVSQSSTTSIRSMESNMNRLPNDYYRKYYDPRYTPISRPAVIGKADTNAGNTKDKKNINVRQFLQMWNEGDDEGEDSSKEVKILNVNNENNNYKRTHEAMNKQEQLYVLGLVNVPSEELGKYEHVQKISKLPENIKGYNDIELLNQFEQAIESSKLTNYKPATPKDYQMSMKTQQQMMSKQFSSALPPRPLSPLDVEAKISQSVIHKEVGCNFEIKPCSPKMLNVEIAAPVQAIMEERSIEKVMNTVMIKSPLIAEKMDNSSLKQQDHTLSVNDNHRPQSCNMISNQFAHDSPSPTIKTAYSMQDLESNSGLCLASLPQLDNDIELNFPEVNQQFINANKDSRVVTPLKDLPTLEESTPPVDTVKDFLSVKSVSQENEVKSPISPYIESGAEFTKLSKYRKSRIHVTEQKENEIHANSIRTDSVIIKNPDSVKNYEESSNLEDSLNLRQDTQQAPINLTSYNNILNSAEKEINENRDKELLDMAIDFTVNKPNANDIKNDNTTIAVSHTEPAIEKEMTSDGIKHINETISLSEHEPEVLDNVMDLTEICTPQNNEHVITDEVSKNDNAALSETYSLSCQKNKVDSNSIKQIDSVSDNATANSQSVATAVTAAYTNTDVNNSYDSRNIKEGVIEQQLPIESNDEREHGGLNCYNSGRKQNDEKITTEVEPANHHVDVATHSNKFVRDSKNCEEDSSAPEVTTAFHDSTQIEIHQKETTESSITYEDEAKCENCVDSLNSEHTLADEIVDDIKLEQSVDDESITEENDFYNISPTETEEICHVSPIEKYDIHVDNGSLFSEHTHSESITPIKPVSRYYVSKELYSPIIQNLITSSEGYISGVQCGDLVSCVDIFLGASKVLTNENSPKTEYSDLTQLNDDSIENKNTTPVKSSSDEINTVKNSMFVDSHEIITNEPKYLDEPVDSHPTTLESTFEIKENPANKDSLPVFTEDKLPDIEDSFEYNTELEDKTFLNNVDNSAYINQRPLKRSLSDSALNTYNIQAEQQTEENAHSAWPYKRRKNNDDNIFAQKLCNIINNNRRNSVASLYTEENVSFCILIDNSCIITEEETENQDKECYNDLSEECYVEIQHDVTNEKEPETELVETEIGSQPEEGGCEYIAPTLEYDEEKSMEQSWVEDVACMETIMSDDIAEDIEISNSPSPSDDALSETEESEVLSANDHTDKVKFIYGDNMCSGDAQLVDTLFNTPQMNVDKTLNRETYLSENSDKCYDSDSLEQILSAANEPKCLSPYSPSGLPYASPAHPLTAISKPDSVELLQSEDIVKDSLERNLDEPEVPTSDKVRFVHDIFGITQDDTVHSCESSIDNVFSYTSKDDDVSYTSSSPEVSSTTSEEKSSSILLKITNYNGSMISQINNNSNIDENRPSCKFTEDKEYSQSHSHYSANRPLLTKAAQKYIPPLKETIRDLKVKLTLPPHSLLKLKQLKLSKNELKDKKLVPTISKSLKKPKPKFEDVLKSIDEIQFKMHKEKNKKSKKAIPKVVIKKSINGSHYASTSNNVEYNPDMTGRKWQPWVFIEKNHFIDQMAIKKKTKAIFSHRKNTYVLAEKFRKYKSVLNANFVMTPPVTDRPSGLKYTIRLKHY